MSKRITLSDFEIEQIITALEYFSMDIGPTNVTNKVGMRYYEEIIKKLRPSNDAVETM